MGTAIVTPRQHVNLSTESPQSEVNVQHKRLFWAVGVPVELKAVIASLQARLRSRLPSGSWPSPENFHLTLAFLGDQEAVRIPSMLDAVRNVLMGTSPFSLETGELGSFPKPKHARVLWLAVQREPKLDGVAAMLRRTLEQQGISFDKKPFKPHLTLARFRNPMDVSTCLESMEPLRFDARKVTLYQSHLTPQGARYEALGEVTLL